MKISDEVYNCLINQAIVMKHELDQTGNDIACKVVEEYFTDDELNSIEKDEIISRISHILGN